MREVKNILWTKISARKTPASTLIDKRFWKYFNPNDKILEVGCGWGRIIFEGINRRFRMTGIDINKNEIKQLKEKVKGLADIRYGNILYIKFKSKFKGSFMQGVLSTLENNQRSKCLKKVKSLLVRGGYLHVSEFKLNSKEKERYNKDFLITKEYGTLSVKDEKNSEIYRSHNFTEKELTDLIKKGGFEVISIKNATFTSYHGNKKPGIMIIAKNI